MKNVNLPVPEEWSDGRDQPLLPSGIKQMEHVGEQLKKRYGHLICDYSGHTSTVIKVTSTKWTRTKESAWYLLSKFHPSYRQLFPIRTNTDDKADIPFNDECPIYSYHFKKANQNYVFANEIKLKNFINERLGKPIPHDVKLMDYIGQILALRAEGRDFGKATWATELVNHRYATMQKYLHDGLFKFVRTEKMMKLFIGPMLNAIKKDIWKMSGPNVGKLHEKISIYSSHDCTLSAILHALKMPGVIAPEFAASIRFEVVRFNGRPEDFIKVLYSRDDNLNVARTKLYSMEKFINEVDEHIITDWRRMCYIDEQMLQRVAFELIVLMFVVYNTLVTGKR